MENRSRPSPLGSAMEMSSRRHLSRQHRLVGLGVAAIAVGLTTVVVYPLAHVAPVTSLGVVYLLAVLLVASVWGAWVGVITAVASAASFNFFHLPPVGHFTIAKGEDWVALAVFLAAALAASSLAERARARTREAEDRRGEADLAAEMARVLLRGNDLQEGVRAAAQRLATALELPTASIELTSCDSDARRVAFALREGPRRIGTLLLQRDASAATLRRAQERIVPALEALLAAALERDRLLGDVVEAKALRRSDVLKTALLRAVSHDLRSPLTAILAASEPLDAARISDADRRELAAVVTEEARRLSRLIDNLLDLSRLETGAAEPRREWSSLEEVIDAAVEDVALPLGAFSVQVRDDVPLVRADAAQLERAFSNLLSNSARYSRGEPVLVRVWPLHNRVVIRVVDRGPGIPPAQRERVFEPFYKSGTDETGHRGSGLGLAIARGFIEANGGRIWVESRPGQSTSFVVELPLDNSHTDARRRLEPPITAPE
jgi:two-component system sensor histidine kinase KdpD